MTDTEKIRLVIDDAFFTRPGKICERLHRLNSLRTDHSRDGVSRRIAVCRCIKTII